MFTDKSKAIAIVNERTEKKKLDDEHREAGGKFCAYCGKIIPKGKENRHTIIFQGRNDFGTRCVVRETNDYCPDSSCGGYDQMAHEG